MGIQGFSKVFNFYRVINWNHLRGSVIAIDGSLEVNRIVRSNNNDGTKYIYSLLSFLKHLKRHSITSIWVFDNYRDKCNHLKSKTWEKRSQTNNRIDDRAFDVVKHILTKSGIDIYETPIEAEKLCSQMSQQSKEFKDLPKVDYVLSNDMDCIMFGTAKLIKRNYRTNELHLYIFDEILHHYNLTYKDLVRICIILGCDFADKTPRIGPKSVLSKYKYVDYTPEQKKAYDFIVSTDSIYSLTMGELDIDNLYSFLIEKNIVDWFCIDFIKTCFRS